MRFLDALKVLCVSIALGAITVPAPAAGAGLTGAGSLSENGAAANPVTHAWIVVPGPGDRGAQVLHLPPRGPVSGRDGRMFGAKPGEVRIATAVMTPPVMLAARDGRLAMVFSDPAGFPQAYGRTLLSLGVTSTSPGVWETPKGRLDSLPSLRGDGLLLGFAGADAGYCALYEGLKADHADSSNVVLQMLVGQAWVDVALPAEVQAAAAQWYKFNADNRPMSSATWRLFATPDGIGLLMLPPKTPDAKSPDGVVGTLITAKLETPGANEAVAPAWSRYDINLPVAAARKDHVSVLCSGGHTVITALSTKAGTREGVLHIFTRPLDYPDHPWREVASIPGISTNHAVVALDGVGRIAVQSATASSTNENEPLKQTLTEVSVGTGAVVYSGDVITTSPISSADYRMIAVILGYALGMVIIFLLKVPRADAVLLPEGYSLAEPGRRLVAGIIDILVAVVIASRIWHLPLGDALSPANWGSDPGQAMILTSVGLMIVLGTGLELLFGRSVGKILTGCEVVAVEEVGANAPKPKTESEPVEKAAGEETQEAEDGPAHGSLPRLLLRNFIKFALPPVAMLGLLDASGRHRGDQLARTAVVVEGIEDEDVAEDEES